MEKYTREQARTNLYIKDGHVPTFNSGVTNLGIICDIQKVYCSPLSVNKQFQGTKSVSYSTQRISCILNVRQDISAVVPLGQLQRSNN